MNSIVRWAALAVILALFFAPAPAGAVFGECSNPDYRARFDEALRPIDYDCIERFRTVVSTPSGSRTIRIVHDRDADWLVSSTEMAEFDRGAAAAATAFAMLGARELEDVTILLADDLPPRDEAGRFSDIAAWTDTQNDNECHVIVYLAGPGSYRRYAAWVIAHELFHCVQAANLSPEQINSGSVGVGGGGDWWIEGSASWFAALALPDPGPLRQFVAGFNTDSDTRPLNRLAYEAVVFFLWLGMDASPEGVMSFMDQMASSRDETAQRAAMASALPQDDWLRFATAYIDSDIRHPHGVDLGVAPTQGAIWQWGETRTEEFSLEPFVLRRGVVAFECGRWRSSVSQSEMHRARAEEGGAWARLPRNIDTMSGTGGSYRFVAMNADASAAPLSITGELEAGCGACAEIVETDSCLFGTWQLTSGGAAEWMRRQGAPVQFTTNNESITLRSDGTFLTGAFSGAFEGRMPDGAQVSGQSQARAGGRWSARGGMLNLCPDLQQAQGRGTARLPGGQRMSVPMLTGAQALTQMRYSCGDGVMNTEMSIPGAPPITSGYRRTER